MELHKCLEQSSLSLSHSLTGHPETPSQHPNSLLLSSSCVCVPYCLIPLITFTSLSLSPRRSRPACPTLWTCCLLSCWPPSGPYVPGTVLPCLDTGSRANLYRSDQLLIQITRGNAKADSPLQLFHYCHPFSPGFPIQLISLDLDDCKLQSVLIWAIMKMQIGDDLHFRSQNWYNQVSEFSLNIWRHMYIILDFNIFFLTIMCIF